MTLRQAIGREVVRHLLQALGLVTSTVLLALAGLLVVVGLVLVVTALRSPS